MPDTQPPSDIAALRAEIDALDDALHDLLMRRAAVVARLAASRAKGAGPALRPGREAAILRRLLGRHGGALPRAALVRIWRELLAATTTMQAPLPFAACLDEAGMEVLRAHAGLAAPISRLEDAAAAIAAAGAGAAALAALPMGRWWRTLDPNRLHVTARLPFFGPAAAPVFLLSPAAPDPSGEDRTLVRLPEAGAEAALRAAGLHATSLTRDGDLALAEIDGFLPAGDPRLPAGAAVLGAYAVPLPS
ncbi:chorismate mutase [Falsiroseomonas sp. CW058]|uniref:chorismate mutase n=1 Tax=Falsiroseomonas sp. CW058 TaxID=3388664 RepID=UPI003D31B5B5